jgi:hypothetical protein
MTNHVTAHGARSVPTRHEQLALCLHMSRRVTVDDAFRVLVDVDVRVYSIIG